MSGSEAAGPAVEAVFREEWGRLLGSLVGQLRDLDLAEEVASDAVPGRWSGGLSTACPRSPPPGC